MLHEEWVGQLGVFARPVTEDVLLPNKSWAQPTLQLHSAANRNFPCVRKRRATRGKPQAVLRLSCMDESLVAKRRAFASHRLAALGAPEQQRVQREHARCAWSHARREMLRRRRVPPMSRLCRKKSVSRQARTIPSRSWGCRSECPSKACTPCEGCQGFGVGVDGLHPCPSWIPSRLYTDPKCRLSVLSTTQCDTRPPKLCQGLVAVDSNSSARAEPPSDQVKISSKAVRARPTWRSGRRHGRDSQPQSAAVSVRFGIPCEVANFNTESTMQVTFSCNKTAI